MKMYKNGALTGTKTDGHEPNVLTRTHHTIGAFNGGTGSFMDGTIAYVKVWHGVELQQSDVTDLYAPDATPMNGPACSADGLSLDGTNDYADIDDWDTDLADQPTPITATSTAPSPSSKYGTALSSLTPIFLPCANLSAHTRAPQAPPSHPRAKPPTIA
ncbi:hypothetical protein TrLO_g8139 [Triparma laevis f. longispina]|uniref:Uncharacterized protein n=1 Tax=Triparma laevis f. longispina TaxID=1714387 RepID=A0A9W7F4H1_9STRA|nr:hypothetical protein TrLO_g8139 [Triparma laevis f. longispina]